MARLEYQFGLPKNIPKSKYMKLDSRIKNKYS